LPSAVGIAHWGQPCAGSHGKSERQRPHSNNAGASALHNRQRSGNAAWVIRVQLFKTARRKFDKCRAIDDDAKLMI
jgi:hypothetical protein